MDVGKIIKHLRQQHGFKQNELATLCSITPAYLSQIEGNHKEPNLATIRVSAENGARFIHEKFWIIREKTQSCNVLS